MEEVLRLEGISKQYTLATERPVLLKNLFWPPKKEKFWALKNIDLAVKKGEVLGIIGENGAGKSTLLKILAGITSPTKGKVKIKGRVSSLIDLGAGFHPDLTGRENIYLNAALMGLTRAEIDSKIKDIITFADIGEFIDSPVRTYSSGMTVRLGFAVAIHLDPDILLIDEVLAVGDEEFQRKCIKKIENLKDSGVTIVFVSHNLNLVSSICSKTGRINRGRLMPVGNTNQVIKKYLKNISSLRIIPIGMQKRWGNGKVVIVKAETMDRSGLTRKTFSAMDKIAIKVDIKFKDNINNPVFGITIKESENNKVYATNTLWKKVTTGFFKKDENKEVIFELDNVFMPGSYFVSPAVASHDLKEYYDWRENYLSFSVGNTNIPKDRLDGKIII